MPALLFTKSIQVQEVFSLLFGGTTVVRETTKLLPAEDEAAVAWFVDAQQVPRHLLVCDFAFANSAGAALSLVPAAVVVQAVKKKEVDENLRDNLREVLNICSNLFLTSEGQAVRLDRVDLPGKLASSPLVTSQQLFEIEIPRYPQGRIRLLTQE